MAPTVGVWRFMDDVQEMTRPGLSIDWSYRSFVDPVVPTPTRVQEDANQPTEALSPEKGSLVAVNTDPLLEDLNNRNKELLQERKNALRWQDAASMAVKEAKEEADTCKQETKTAKKAEQQAAATIQQQLIDSRQEMNNALKWQDTASMAIKEAKDEAESRKQEARAATKAGHEVAAELQQKLVGYINQVAALKRGETRAGLEKNRADAEHRKEILVVERKIKELQTGLSTAISHGRGSIASFDELSRISQDMLNELVIKDRKLAAIEQEKERLQERINARTSVFDDLRKDARNSREAHQKSCREKDKSEKAQRAAERKVVDLEREAVKVKAATDKRIKALETRLAESVAREAGANTRVIKAEGDVEELRRELNNTELARRSFEKKEGDWAALFAANPSRARASTTNAPDFGTQWQPSATITVVEASRPSENPFEENSREDWEKDTRRQLEEQTQTILATEREKLRHELEEEKRKTLAAERRPNYGNVKSSLKTLLVSRLKAQKKKEERKVLPRAAPARLRSKKRQVDWDSVRVISQTTEIDRSQLETQIRGQFKIDFDNELANRKTTWDNERDHEQSQLKTQIRSELQHEHQTDLASHRIRWESEYAATERPRIEAEIRTQLETEFNERRIKWQTEFVDSERPILERKIRADIEDEYGAQGSNFDTQDHSRSDAGPASQSQIEVGEPRDAASATARSPEDDMLLASLSRESDEAHELFQEIGRVGISHGSATYTVLQGLNWAKEALYTIKCELRNADAVANKNNLLRAVKGVHINTHYIEKLSRNTREVLIRQALEANKRLEYVKNILGTNDDVEKDGMLKFLLEPLETEPEHMDIPEYPQIGSISENATAFGASRFPQTVNGVREPAAASISNFTTVNDSANSAAPGTSAFGRMVNSFGDVATSSTSGSHQKPSLASDPKPFNGFGDGTTLGVTKTETSTTGNSKFKKTFQPLPTQGERPAPRTDSSDMDHQMDTDGSQSTLSACQDHSGVIGVAISPSRSRQAKPSQRRSAPKGRQLAHQAFAKKQDTLTSKSAQTQQTKSQEQVPAAQEVGSFGVSRTAFTLEPNHAFDVAPSSSLVDRGTHLRVQQDPAEYQKPLKMFRIPEDAAPERGTNIATSRESTSGDQSWQPEVVPSQAEDVTPETPPGCEGWTSDMEKYAQDFLKDADMEQFKFELWSLYPSTKHMPGLARYLQKLKQDMKAAEPDQVQSKRKSKQPAGWTAQMTEFVEGLLFGGNDVNTIVNLFRNEIADAFDIQGLEEHVEKMKNELVRKNNALAQQHQVSPAPMGWNNRMTATVQEYLRGGGRDVEFLVQDLEVTEPDAVHLTGLHKYVTFLVLKYQTQGGR